MTKNEVIRQATKFCEDNKIESFPVKIIELCEKFGISVYEEYLPEDVSGFIVVQKENFNKYPSNKVIVVNLLDSARRRRFTIAHELAHYILHREDSELFAHRDAGQHDEKEIEANIFASNILMPKKLVKKSLKTMTDLWGDMTLPFKVEHIANHFAVSMAAAQVRLEQLGIY